MASKKTAVEIIALQCSECKRKNYTTYKNRKNIQGKLELNKYCWNGKMKGKVSLLKDKAFLGALLLCFVAAAVLIAANYYDIQQKKNDNYVDLNNVNQGGSQLAEASPENAEENTATQQDEMFGLDNVMDATDEVQQIEESEMEEVSGNSVKNEKDNFDEVPGTTPGDAQSVSGNAVNHAVENISFDENTIMKWPIKGEVLKPYHMDSMLYFATLDQYKYNPALIIGCETGNSVKAAADGKIVSVEKLDETGNTITVDLGNGYQAIYGQLKDITVKEGDSCKAGEVLGSISDPSHYYMKEGSNLYFQLTKDGTAVNPLDYLN